VQSGLTISVVLSRQIDDAGECGICVAVPISELPAKQSYQQELFKI
jgi:hypothetical protein